MAEVLGPPAPLFASRGGTSIKSFKFREHITSSSPPSIGGDSTRRRAFGMSSLLGRRTKNAAPPDLDTLVINEKLLAHTETCASENMDPVARNPARRDTEPAPAPTSKQQPPPAKSRTMFRKLTTRFNRTRSRSTSPPASNKRRSVLPPKLDVGTTSAAARNAALRERGLLPPLPLSVQERQQDSRIAIVASPEPQQQAGLQRQTTAASRIKEEWEAQNRQRFAEFRFGGSSPMSSPLQENFPDKLESLTEVETPLVSPDEQEQPPKLIDDTDDEPEAERKVPRPPPPTLHLNRGQQLSPPLMQAWSDTPPDSHSLPLPLPPVAGSADEHTYSSLISAFTATPTADSQFTPISPSFLPLPPSPSVSSASLNTAQPDTETPRAGPGGAQALSAASRETSPSSRSLTTSALDPSESESSLGVPSLMLDTESQTTVSTADSFGSFGRMRNAQLATKVRNSTIESQGASHHAISVIVENPSEERDGTITASPVEEAVDAVPPQKTSAPAQATPRRRETEPTPAAADRRKSTGVGMFKRGKGEGLSSMLSIRRSMGFGRAKSAVGPPAGFDVSKLPPSPTLPAEFGGQQQATSQQATPQLRGRTVAAGAGHAHRLSVGPTMHSRASILFETAKIEDEESRRMTELAFM